MKKLWIDQRLTPKDRQNLLDFLSRYDRGSNVQIIAGDKEYCPIFWSPPRLASLYQQKLRRNDIDEIREWFDILSDMHRRSTLRVHPPSCTPKQRMLVRQWVNDSPLLWDKEILRKALHRIPSPKAELVVYDEMYARAIAVALFALETRNLLLWSHITAVLGVSILHSHLLRVSLEQLELKSREQKAVKSAGVSILSEEGEPLELFYPPRLQDKATRQFLLKIWEPILFLGKGNTAKLTEDENHEVRKASSLMTVQKSRALDYCNRAWSRYIKKKQELQKKGSIDLEELRIEIIRIDAEEFSKKTPAKKEGRRHFLKQVKEDLRSVSSLTRTRKPSSFSQNC